MKHDRDAVTPRQRLRTGLPVWLRHGNARVACSPLAENFTVDVAIVGAGVSGALVGQALLRAGLRVAVFDRRGPVRGATPASTALLQFDLDMPLLLLAERIGRAKALRAYWRSATAVDLLRGTIEDLGLRCGFRQREAIYLPGNVLDAAGLRREAEMRALAGLRSRYLHGPELRRMTGIEREGALISGGAGQLDPVALVAGLWRAFHAKGGRIHAPTDIVDVDAGHHHVTLGTADGFSVQARHVVFATGYERVKLVDPRDYRIASTWVIATAPQSRRLWPSRSLIWEAADPYLYVRTTLDGRVIAGGEDEDIADEKVRDALLPAKIETLRRKLAELLPDLDTAPEFAWAGCFGSTPTSLPAIGSIPGSPRCYAILGYGGNGITFSSIAAQLIPRAILGLRDPDASLFALHD